ncbi:dTDP-glucose 4,6-dehydratase [Alcanivorax quisquiliarum]|uniref:dTDP-glucose 4,6-dehydratase n=1 Tax=Alcanivorax quisquiliarum TaxID=2933565 RepID=A0ABT0E3I8_9GAMM|nr:dTDP-glucose 4,6-dehydratase [Alcanivorax quisquiliarum]MCK0536376.1 dTDP-glucose 4,6-dehydratase [Alcanivorax quisquiliarum]
MTLMVTGGCGFIGVHLVHWLLAHTDERVINIDALTYAAQPVALKGLAQPRYTFVQADVTDQAGLATLLDLYQPRALLHLAAETHVDRSIQSPEPFLRHNVQGTHAVLEAVRGWLAGHPARAADFRMLQVSTDEVYGDLGPTGAPAREGDAYRPGSPYAASKAAADHLADAWFRTWGVPVLVSHCTNNYGPWQYPEKLIPVVIRHALRGEPIPLYGSGRQVRDWLHVEDHVRALWLLLEKGSPGEHYNIGADNPRNNFDLVNQVCRILDEMSPSTAPAGGHATLIAQVADRPGHDWRYGLDSSKIQALGWQAATPFDEGLRETVRFYIEYYRRQPGGGR